MRQTQFHLIYFPRSARFGWQIMQINEIFFLKVNRNREKEMNWNEIIDFNMKKFWKINKNPFMNKKKLSS